MKEIIALTVFIICNLILLFAVWVAYRNYRVFTFRGEIIELTHRTYSTIRIFDEGPSYNEMLFSFKKLTAKNWYPELAHLITEK